jgi:hypothetical protein
MKITNYDKPSIEQVESLRLALDSATNLCNIRLVASKVLAFDGHERDASLAPELASYLRWKKKQKRTIYKATVIVKTNNDFDVLSPFVNVKNDGQGFEYEFISITEPCLRNDILLFLAQLEIKETEEEGSCVHVRHFKAAVYEAMRFFATSEERHFSHGGDRKLEVTIEEDFSYFP